MDEIIDMPTEIYELIVAEYGKEQADYVKGTIEKYIDQMAKLEQMTLTNPEGDLKERIQYIFGGAYIFYAYLLCKVFQKGKEVGFLEANGYKTLEGKSLEELTVEEIEWIKNI